MSVNNLCLIFILKRSQFLSYENTAKDTYIPMFHTNEKNSQALLIRRNSLLFNFFFSSSTFCLEEQVLDTGPAVLEKRKNVKNARRKKIINPCTAD